VGPPPSTLFLQCRSSGWFQTSPPYRGSWTTPRAVGVRAFRGFTCRRYLFFLRLPASPMSNCLSSPPIISPSISDGASWRPTWAVPPLGFSSRFLLSTQQLLQEFCSLSWPLPTSSTRRRQQGPHRKERASASTSWAPSLQIYAKEKLSKLNLYLEQWMLIVLLCLLEN
jgi:hypothetical protein